jgi:hypothetical protein
VFWSRCKLRAPPYIHPADKEVVAANPKLFDTKITTFESFLKGELSSHQCKPTPQNQNAASKSKEREISFCLLGSEMCWRPGFVWWEKKLREVIGCIAEAKNVSYAEAMQSLSQRLAVVELVPYHSGSFKAHKIIETLPSVQASRIYVRNTLLPKARRNDAVIIITLKIKAWGIRGGNVVLYEGGETRGASMSVKSKGGRAILKRYGIVTRR